MPKPHASLLQAALVGYEHQLQTIREQMASIRNQLGHRTTVSSDGAKPKVRRRISAAGRRRIAAAQRARWAAQKAGKATPAPERRMARRKMSAKGKAAIRAALKKRWAEYRAKQAAS